MAEKVKVHAAEPEEEEEEELVDPMETVREQCAATKKCAAFEEKLRECNARVSSRKKTTETCTEELFDFLHCRDHCVSEKLFKQLK